MPSDAVKHRVRPVRGKPCFRAPDLSRQSDREASRQNINLSPDFQLRRDNLEHYQSSQVITVSAGVVGRLLLGFKDCVNSVASFSYDPRWRRQEEENLI